MTKTNFTNRNKILIFALIIFFAVALSYFLPITSWIKYGLSYVKGLGIWGMLLFALAYIIATVLMLPGTILTLGAGLIYGPLVGTLIVSPASVVGATLAFLLCRHLLRSTFEKKISDNKKFAAVDQAIAEQGAKIVLLLRLSPIFPFNLLNYALGLSKIPLLSYVRASFIGMLPGTFMYVYFGSVATSLADLSGGVQRENIWSTLLYWGGLVATLVVTVFITKTARKALREALVEQNTEGPVVGPTKDVDLSVLPHDIYNKELLENVHPNNYINPKPQRNYNLVVIGGGTAGLISTAGAAGLGAKVALVERQFMGGDCLNYGCVPSKAILRPAHFLREVKESADMGFKFEPDLPFDFSNMMMQMRKIRANISHHDSVKRFKSMGADVFLGQATFSGPNSIKVGGQVINFKKAIIASGARARALEIEGAKEVELLNNENIFMLTSLPKSMIVLGGGPIGCEIAQAFASFGTEVTLIEAGGQILVKDDQEAANVVLEQMTKDGVKFEFMTQPIKVEQVDNRKIIHAQVDQKTAIFTADEIFCALGRVPNIEGLGLHAAGVSFDSNGLVVNDFLQTSNPNIFAAGDICSRYQFTHAADAMARIAIQNALFFGRKKASSLVTPWCTYTNPELAHVGLSLSDAEKLGFDVGTLSIPMNSIDRALLDRDCAGFLRIHYDKKSKGTILGASAVSSHAGELLGALTIAITNKLTLSQIANTIFPYPTKTEVFKRAADAYNRTRLSPSIAYLLKKFLSWRRL